MVKLARKKQAKPLVVVVVVGIVLTFAVMFGWCMDKMNTTAMMNSATRLSNMAAVVAPAAIEAAAASKSFDPNANAQVVKECREKVRETCKSAKTKDEVLAISDANSACYKMPVATSTQPRDDTAIRACKFVFMDFGANVGDTSGHLIDSGTVGCEKKDLGAKAPIIHFSVGSKSFETIKRRNPLTNHLVKLIEEASGESGPESYCYYGVEGNPVFTERLRAIEDHVMAIQPRPIKHMHFFTESVGAGEDGPTKLYLDTINGEQNFWGSSIMAGHQDVRKSAEENKSKGGSGEKVTAAVTGYTIGTLMRKTLAAFQPGATEEDKKGNHLVLKVDIEGGEYPLMAQAHTEGTLCEFVKMGNKADLFIEFHSQRVTGPHKYASKVKQWKEDLTKCGVNFRNLAAWWA